MDKEFEKKYHNEEVKNWWFSGRRSVILQTLNVMFVNKKSFILDIGCSGGVLLDALRRDGYKNITGVDKSKQAIELCLEKGLDAHIVDGTSLFCEKEKFDVIIASDVLEHIKDHQEALKSWYAMLKNDGSLIVFVPAFMFLWSAHDETNHHFRRYSQKRLLSMLKQAGFSITRKSYWNFLLFFPVVFVTLIKKYFLKINKKDRLYHLDSWVNGILLYILKFENFIIRFVNFPVGMSVFVVAKKNN